MGIEFRGVYTAIVTPFKADTSIDWDAFEKLIEFQIAGGVAGIVPCGTTGESPTLTEEEQGELIARVIEIARKRCQVVAGTGSNCTAKAVALSQRASDLGADACMIVNPYYNKPTQEGLFRHFKAVADAVRRPIMIYNIQGRTGVNVETTTLMRLVDACKNILAVKEASGKIEQMKDVLAAAPKGFSVLSGDDNLTLELTRIGGQGVVSVASNIIPGKIVALVQHALAKEWREAEALNEDLQTFFTNLFIETNPIPAKAALAMQGKCQEVYRLPMCELRPANREKWSALLKSMGLFN